MNQRNVMFTWLASVLLMAVLAGTPWISVVLTPEAGGQLIDITGYMVYPVASALILLQGSALLASFFTPVQVGRVLAGGVAIVMSWHLVTVATTLVPSMGSSMGASIETLTGVAGLLAQQELVSSTSESLLWAAYLVAVVLNILILAIKAIRPLHALPSKVKAGPNQIGMDLWDAQK